MNTIKLSSRYPRSKSRSLKYKRWPLCVETRGHTPGSEFRYGSFVFSNSAECLLAYIDSNMTNDNIPVQMYLRRTCSETYNVFMAYCAIIPLEWLWTWLRACVASKRRCCFHCLYKTSGNAVCFEIYPEGKTWECYYKFPT